MKLFATCFSVAKFDNLLIHIIWFIAASPDSRFQGLAVRLCLYGMHRDAMVRTRGDLVKNSKVTVILVCFAYISLLLIGIVHLSADNHSRSSHIDSDVFCHIHSNSNKNKYLPSFTDKALHLSVFPTDAPPWFSACLDVAEEHHSLRTLILLSQCPSRASPG
jgi:hypothetical protein